ncbi:AAA family ATPase [Chlorogloea sp. CCALA 695]|uniref:AAA family ATPase n=1 Tax=Chlorogloea sp. CCALA 695 TaxID=2107693 RepID=UPI000D06DAA5|nr:ATP-binding protein [Chlorogloea sp. CCALA 695]PSB30818.1 hypothetical protein C7B70_15295 [Chlorogloea sp. CCALA 695]
MSLAGKRSSEGDEYQLRVALHWLIQLVEDNAIQGIQVNSTGLPQQDYSVTVDDVVVIYANGHTCFIQAKKNQTGHDSWSLSDKELQKELCKARDQLETTKDSEVKFYSRSPFGELKALVENCKKFPDYSAFVRDAPKNQIESLKRLSKILERSEQQTYILLPRLGFGPTFEFEDWDHQNSADLDRLVPRADFAMPILERYLSSHETNLRDSRYVITRTDVLSKLAEHGLSPTPKLNETEILEAFTAASSIGRNWLRQIAGTSISRVELPHLIKLIEQGSSTILLTDRPGSGKTCLLLDLADNIEQSSLWGLLFIKGDQFANVNTEQELSERGLPKDIVGQCARLAGFRRVVVVIDSLDVLSLSRQHSTIRVFLGLMDRLERVENVTVIAACRKFDLEYDPLLRSRSWNHTVNLQLLDFESVVKPFLLQWGVNLSSISPELQALLQLPQNLRIYEKLVKLGTTSQPATAYELYNIFLEEVVAKNPQLGDKALVALQNMAEHLIQQRSQYYPKVASGVGEDVVRQLISQEVLWEPSNGVLAFSHQTLADCLIVRATLAQKRTLEQFILKHPQLPFIRPAVRAFFFFLHASQPKIFRQQVWRVLSHDEIAYHVKRLICESFAEIVPVEEDWRLLHRIFQEYPDLFRRLLWRVEGNAWFNILTQHWLLEAKVAQDRETWLFQFIQCLQVWMNQYPVDVVKLWKEAIDSNWASKPNVIRVICSALTNFRVWDAEGVRQLLEVLIKESSTNLDFGDVLSRWVQATNSGDDLLWSYITRNVLPEDVRPWGLGDKLCCGLYAFHQETFLVERISQSDDLLNLVINGLEHWSAESAVGLHNISWVLRHSQGIHPVDNLTILLDSLEKGLKHRASFNDTWWRKNEPKLRITQEQTIRYFVIQAYKENIQANGPGIEYQLQDKELLSWSRLKYELGELILKAYPHISESTWINNQSLILSFCSGEDSNEGNFVAWEFQSVYDLLTWIPCNYQSLETQAFIAKWQDYFGYSRPSANIYSQGGIVMPPLSPEALLKLSDDGLFRLLQYYEKYQNWNPLEENLVGGFSEFRIALCDACSLHPIHFLLLFNRFIGEDLHQDYVQAIIEGVATHLSYRFSNVKPAYKWEPISPLPDGEMLAAKLLSLLERYSLIWKNGHTASQALEACCNILDDPESAERLSLLLFWLVWDKDPSADKIANNQADIDFIAINSTRGVAAKSAMTLCNRLLEKDQSLPELLPFLLHHFARDQAIGIRVSILWQLPFLIHKRPDLGWQLLANVFQESQSQLWKYAEQCFYYQYKNCFNLVAPYLDRLLHEGIEDAGSTWGCISTLACLAGYINQQQLFDSLTETNNVNAWKGATEVFIVNLDQHQHTVICYSGLMTILRQKSIAEEIIWKIERCFAQKNTGNLISSDLALAFLDALPVSSERYEIYHLFEWLSYEASRDPLSALDVTEVLAEKLEGKLTTQALGRTQPLIKALNEIFREADETDDLNLIQRVIKLQDHFLKLNINGIEELLAKAGQN